MPGATYFPILRAKQGEIEALGRLSPTARLRTRPLLDLALPKRDESLELTLCGTAQDLARNWGTELPCYLDLSLFDPDVRTGNGKLAVQYVFNCARQCRLKAIPVSAPRSVREDSLTDAVKGIVAETKLGAAIRIPHFELSAPDSLGSTIDATALALALDDTQIDLFLDVGPLSGLAAAHQAANALLGVWADALRAINGRPFRNIILCASNIPANTKSRAIGIAHRMPRVEMTVWRELTGKEARDISFGDYGARFGNQVDPHGPVIPPSRVHISTGDEYLFYRAERNDHRQLSRGVAETKEFYGQADSWGKEVVRDCGNGSGDAGNPGDWVARDTNMHIETTVRELDRRLAALGRLTPLRSAQAPWLQTSFL